MSLLYCHKQLYQFFVTKSGHIAYIESLDHLPFTSKIVVLILSREILNVTQTLSSCEKSMMDEKSNLDKVCLVQI